MPTCMASIKLWPAAHAINFAFIPSSQRILYINVISVRSPLLQQTDTIHVTVLLLSTAGASLTLFPPVLSKPGHLKRRL